jgi:L-fucose isomerase-like protein
VRADGVPDAPLTCEARARLQGMARFGGVVAKVRGTLLFSMGQVPPGMESTAAVALARRTLQTMLC